MAIIPLNATCRPLTVSQDIFAPHILTDPSRATGKDF